MFQKIPKDRHHIKRSSSSNRSESRCSSSLSIDLTLLQDNTDVVEIDTLVETLRYVYCSFISLRCF